jgi:hypothetical protein
MELFGISLMAEFGQTLRHSSQPLQKYCIAGEIIYSSGAMPSSRFGA